MTCNEGSGSGCDKIYYTTDGTTPTTSSLVYSSPINISVTTPLKFFAKDLVGNSESVQTQTYYIGIDSTPPTTTGSPTGGTYNSAQSVTLTCNDGSGFGCDKIYYTTDGTTPTTSSPVYSSPINVSVTTTLKFFARDFGGNSETVKTENYTIDTTPPTGTIAINSGATSTNSLNVTLTLTCNDASGCSQMTFSNNDVDYSTSETYSATKLWTLSPGDGTKTVYAKYKDSQQNWSTAFSDTIEFITDSYTKSLLHMNGTDQSTTFTDDGPGGSHTWTAYGNAKLTTADKKFGSASGTFDGNGDYISTPYSSDFNFGSGDFTIDLWFKRSGGIGTNQYLGLYSSYGAGIGYFMIQIYTNNKFYLTFWDTSNNSHQLTGTTTITDTNTWHHLAFVKNGSTITEYIDGTACGTHNIGALTIYNNTQWGPAWGRMGDYTSDYFNGKLDEVRISKGIARWTSNFTALDDEYYSPNDTTPPTTTVSPTGGTYSSAQVTLTCNDGSGFGCDKIYYTTDGTTPTTSSSIYSSPIDISVTTTLKFFSKDLASNSETVKTEVYTIDSTPPTGSITINSGAASTGSSNVTLTLTCSDANGCSQMKFSNDDVDYSTAETYSATKTWTLSSGNGTKTVYVKFKDSAGNWSGAYSDTIECNRVWLSGWSYRKSITLSRASGAVSNYQMKLLVGETSGATGENVDCGGHIQSDFDDLRFTNSNGDLLDYWIESITGTTPNQLTTVWIKFDSIGTGTTTFYMFYGKADASSVSNGANTFIVFDNFERGSNGDTVGGNWTESYAHVHISTEQAFGGTRSSKFVGAASTAAANIPVTPSDNVAIRFRFYYKTGAANDQFHGNSSKAPYPSFQGNLLAYYDGSWHYTGGSLTQNAWQLAEIRSLNWSAGTFSYYINDSVRLNNVSMYTSSSLNGAFSFSNASSGAGVDIYMDDFLVRHWRSTEPTWGSWGNEEVW